MLTATRQHDNAKVVAAQVDRAGGPYLCTSCRRALVLNKGRIRVHHFRHAAQVPCHHGNGESLAHLHCKMEIFEALAASEFAADVDVEKPLGPAIADVYARIRGQPVAIEVQRSVLSVADIRLRTEVYAALGIPVLWIVLFPDAPADTHHQPTACERWLHAAYLGRVYYWAGGPRLRPVHYDEHRLPVDGRCWFEPGGDARTVPAHTRASRRFRTPSAGPLVDLTRDFRPRLLSAFAAGTVEVPRRRLFIDGRPRWWHAMRPQ